ncbi:hypothetical protein OAQ99_01765 [Candidatus Kapabacteria bacterium]|nr:hypothetical protein [Candidatus Kapabacteria bacterium]
MADNLDLQEPEKPKKKKNSGSISMPVFVGSLLGMGLLVAVVVIFILQYVIKEPDAESSGKDGTEQVEESVENELSELDMDEQAFLEDEKSRRIMELEEILTNPLGSTKFVQISLSLTYRPHQDINAEENLKEESQFYKKIKTKTINTVSGTLRKMDETAIKNISYEELQEIFIEELKDYYAKNKLFLREIYITKLLLVN